MTTNPSPDSDVVDLMAKISARVVNHDAQVRAAAQLVTESILRHKIASYVQADGWIEWTRLAMDLIAGLPWSGGEKRLARIACSLSGQLDYLEDTLDRDDLQLSYNRAEPHAALRAAVRVLSAWSLAECLWGLDDDTQAAVLDAVTLAVTGVSRGGR